MKKRFLFISLFLLLSLFWTPSWAQAFSQPPQTLLLDGTSYTYSPSSDRFSSPSGPVSPEKARLLKILLSFAGPEDRVISLLPVTLHQRRYQAYCLSTGADSDPKGAFFHTAIQEVWEDYHLRVLVLDESGQRVKDEKILRSLFQAYATGSQLSQSERYRNASSLDSDRPSRAPLRFVQTVSSDLATQLVFADQALAQVFTDLIKGGHQVQTPRYEAALRGMLLREQTDVPPDLGSEIASSLQAGVTSYSLLSEAISAGRYSPHPLVLAKLRGMEKELGRLEKGPAMKAFLISPDALNLVFTLAEKEAYFQERVEALQRISLLLHQRKDANPHLLQAMDRVLAQANQTREEEITRHLFDFLLEYNQSQIVGLVQEEIVKAAWKGSQPGARTLARHLLASALAQASLGLTISNLLWGMDAIYANSLEAQSAMEIKEELKRLYDQTYHRERLQSSYPAEYCQDLTALVSFIRLCNASFYQNLADIAGSSALKTALVDQFAQLMGGPTLSGAIAQNRQFSIAIEKHLEQELLSPPGVEYGLKASLEPHALASLPATYQDSLTGMEFVLVKGGCFQMGDIFGGGDADERPIHEVCLDDFWMGKYEVTQGQWKRIMGENPAYFQKGEDYPVEQVSWNQIQEFLRELSRRTGRSYRLPSEAEWEYAARSGGRAERWAGTNSESELGEFAWYWDNFGSSTHPVGQKRPNGLGLYDMSGNVWEWCQDRYGTYPSGSVTDPTGPSGWQPRVIRGGSWFNVPRLLRASFRGGSVPSSPGDFFGFRLALSAR